MVGRFTRDVQVAHDPFEVAEVVAGWSPETIDHGTRTMRMAVQIARSMGLASSLVGDIAIAALVHDAGKIGVPESILRAPRSLNEAEWQIVRRHPSIGAELLGGALHSPVARIVQHHHERWDGAGYPFGLSGKAIPVGARVVAVADAYDAMTSDRPYRRAIGHDRAIEMLIAHADRQFDRAVVDAAVGGPVMTAGAA